MASVGRDVAGDDRNHSEVIRIGSHSAIHVTTFVSENCACTERLYLPDESGSAAFAYLSSRLKRVFPQEVATLEFPPSGSQSAFQIPLPSRSSLSQDEIGEEAGHPYFSGCS